MNVVEIGNNMKYANYASLTEGEWMPLDARRATEGRGAFTENTSSSTFACCFILVDSTQILINDLLIIFLWVSIS